MFENGSKIFSHNLTIYYQNVRGMRTKIQNFYLSVLDNSFDVITITETWLNADISSSEFMPSIYNVFRKDRCPLSTSLNRGGGVLIAVHSSISAGPVPLLHDGGIIEQLCVSLGCPSDFQLFVVVSYIPPGSSYDVYNYHIQNIVDLNNKLKDNQFLCIMGDFNLSNLKWNWLNEENFAVPVHVNSSIDILVVDTLISLSLNQINVHSNLFDKFLDLVFISGEIFGNVKVNEYPLLPLDSHHSALIINIGFIEFHKICYDSSVSFFDFRNSDFIKLSSFLDSVDWVNILNSDNVEYIYNVFLDILLDGFTRFVPKKSFVPNSHPPWFNKSLIRLKNVKNKVHKKYKRSGSDFDLEHFRRLRREFEFLHRFLFKQYISNLQSNINSDPRSFWTYIRKRKASSGIPTVMEYKDVTSNNLEGICNLFADFFESVFCLNRISSSNVAVGNFYSLNIGHLEFSVEEMLSSLMSLDSNSKAGPDNIPPLVLKNCALSLALPLNIMLNTSLRKGVFLDDWKLAFMTPIHKSGEKCKISNYRGVTKASAIPKLFDSLVKDRLFSLVKEHISPHQHGFMSGRSTTTNLVLLTNFITNCLENNSQADAIYFDIVKAFDRIQHDLIIHKLKCWGIHSSLLSWIASFLDDRKLFVKIESCRSKEFSAKSGVPQGSHLGPLLFLLCINDVSSCFKFSRHLLYADDLKLFSCIASVEDCLKLQSDIDAFERWCVINGLEISLNKCKCISFYRIRNPIAFDYTISDTHIERASSVKDLGVIFDHKLSFNSHIDYIVSKSFAMLGFIKRNTRDFDDPYALKSLFCSLVRPYLEYSSVVWSPSYDVHIGRIESVQRVFTRFAIRKLNWANSLPPYEARCQLIGLKSLKSRRKMAAILFVLDVINYKIQCPELLGCFYLYAPERPLRSREMFFIPYHRTNYGKRDPVTVSVKLFNLHCFDIDHSIPRAKFKEKLQQINL